MWAFFVLLAVGGVLLASALSEAEDAVQMPTIGQPDAQPTTRIASPQPLSLPDRFTRVEEPEERATEIERPAPRRQVDEVVREPETIVTARPLPPTPQPRDRRPLPIENPPPPAPQVVYTGPSSPGPVPVPTASGTRTRRVTASTFLNPSLTIPQGTVIQAVLETALDSTRAGGVRALVQRDVSSFDGSRVLIPRGSRLYGEYEANLQRGQKRALVQWTRLIRPDGVTINLDSPSSDPLGRAGIKGKVDSKFLQRFGGAILQSVLDIGVGVAVNRATDGVIVALPGSTQNVQVTEPQSIQPTLKVRHGTSVSVFVARDLDFSTVES
jgi:type IV secretion system protein VirB10